MKKSCAIISLFFICTHVVLAQNLPVFRHYNIKGLAPKSIITSIYQDKEGFLWFGGLTGLYRYNGNILTRFQHNPADSSSLPHNYITGFCEDSKGNLVCGSLGEGVFIMNKRSEKVTKPAASRQSEDIGKGRVIRMVTHSTFGSSVWCGTSPGTLFKYDPATKNFEHILSFNSPSVPASKTTVSAVLELHPDKLLVASYNGLYYLDAVTKKIVPISSINSALSRLDTLQIYSLLMDNANRVWIGYKGGVTVVDGKNFDPFSAITQTLNQNLASLTVKAISQLKDGQVLLGTNNGIFCWNDGNGAFKSLATDDSSFEHSPKIINSFYTGRDGNVWVATETQGLFLLNKNYSFFKTIPGLKQLMNSGKLSAIMEDVSGNWWLGGDNGLVRFKKNIPKTEPIQLKGSKTPAIYSIFQDVKGGIWVGTMASGLYYIPDLTKPSVQQHIDKIVIEGNPDIIDYITAINQDRFGNLWFGTFANGIFIYDQKAGTYFHNAALSDIPGDKRAAAISQIIKDKQGDMWISTLTNGFNKFIADGQDPGKGKFINYTTDARNPNSLSFPITLALKEDSNGNLWIATVSGGLNKFDPVKKQFTRFSTDDGLPSNLIYHLEEDKRGNIWFSTDEGLAMLPPNSTHPVSFKEEDGLPTRSFTFLSSCKMSDGTIAFGTIDGNVVYFQPEGIEKNDQSPAIVDFQLFNRSLTLGELGIFNKPIHLADTFRLKYDQSVFTFEFTNFDLINPDNYVFAYKLDGIDKDWNYVSNRKSATYTNLSAGKYLFHLKAANHTGVWSDKETTKWLIISPPWWRTWWAYTLYAVLFIAGLWFFIYYRSRSLIREKRILEQKVSTRTAEVVQQKEEIAIQRDNLEHTLTELKSTQSQLIQSEKMASLGELTAGIAHEIQNPLNFVNNFSEVNTELIDELKNELNSGNKEEALSIADDIKDNEEKINHHGRRADAIVKGMLQHSRSSTGHKEPTDINALADEYLRLSYHGFRAKDKTFNATLQTNFDESIGKINIIPQDIGRVILNLINNAFYAVSEKMKQQPENYEPTVSVSTKIINDAIEIRVRDNGNGIPQKVLDKIFQPFFTTKPTGQGTGLGLSLSYDIVKAHGGEIKVETMEGEFAEFVIVLPQVHSKSDLI